MVFDKSSVLQLMELHAASFSLNLAVYCINVHWLLPLRRKQRQQPHAAFTKRILGLSKISQIDNLEFQLVQRWIPKMRPLVGFFQWAHSSPTRRSSEIVPKSTTALTTPGWSTAESGNLLPSASLFFGICWKFVRTIMTAQIRNCESKVSPCPFFEKLAKLCFCYMILFMYGLQGTTVYILQWRPCHYLFHPKKSILNLDRSFGWKIGKA